MFYKTLASAVVAACIATGATAETLRFSSIEPPVAFLTSKVFSAWGKAVEDATAGEVKVKIFAGGTLGRSPAQQLKLVEDGVADVAFIVPGYNPGVFPGVIVGELPFVVPSAKAGSLAMWSVYEQGLLEGDFDKYKIIALFTSSPQYVASKPEIRMPSDLQGRNFRASSPSLLAVIEDMGAVAVGGITGPTVAESLSRGVIEGSFNEWNAIKSYRIADAIDHVLEVPMGTSPLMIVMNKARFEGLSEAAQAGIDAVSGATFATAFGDAFDAQIAATRADYVAQGRIAITVPDRATLDAWKAASQPVIDDWLAAAPGRPALLAAYRAAIGE
ncbi:TRAP transporter substrate-binding protein [Pseudodonghicola flavimaris]|uniref:TRAP transporter substrate-binding protein n=1 Tax=Pseudodonghicola flavimaris TaxID=3050036 RepID=A0ABT7F2M1_9RHOB|nr:TRAP transporter substrate-binding protein [Pseudodonghicola flavimaris]MDK3018825.1 TRAP transporter substrate-binding protein [Pseudodonghicola flavimaris]